MKEIQALQYKEQFEKIKEFFSDLQFNEELHKYSLPNIEIKKSVSGVIKEFVPKTDFYNIAKNIDRKLSVPEGTTFRLWNLKGDMATSRGNRAHFFGEIYAKHKGLVPESGLETAIKSFIDNLPKHIIVAFTELTMYHKQYLFAGTADLILYDLHENVYYIADYKTNEDLFRSYGYMLPPFKYLKNNNFNKYSLQFSFYQLMLEQTGVKVKGRALIWLKDSGMYKVYSTKNLTKQLNKYLDENKKNYSTNKRRTE